MKKGSWKVAPGTLSNMKEGTHSGGGKKDKEKVEKSRQIMGSGGM